MGDIIDFNEGRREIERRRWKLPELPPGDSISIPGNPRVLDDDGNLIKPGISSMSERGQIIKCDGEKRSFQVALLSQSWEWNGTTYWADAANGLNLEVGDWVRLEYETIVEKLEAPSEPGTFDDLGADEDDDDGLKEVD